MRSFRYPVSFALFGYRKDTDYGLANLLTRQPAWRVTVGSNCGTLAADVLMLIAVRYRPHDAVVRQPAQWFGWLITLVTVASAMCLR